MKFLRKLTDFIVDHKNAFLATVIFLAGVSAFFAFRVNINHDIMKYMPEDSETSKGVAIMDNEFKDVATSSFEIMFEDLTLNQEAEVTSYLQSVPEVEKIEHGRSDKYIREKDGTKYFLYTVTVKGDADSAAAKNVYTTIDKHFKNGPYKYTEKGEIYEANGEILSILIIIAAVAAAVFIIWIFSDSHIEPFLYLFVILLAVIINKGTNIFLPSVSHITDAIAAILQMALSMDYSIMLASRYREERLTEKNKTKAMKKALGSAFSSISSSSLTTIVGLIVLIFMSFTIGRDMGIVLSKGVLLSLLCIFTAMPSLLLFFDPQIMNSKKRALHINMAPFGNFAYKTRVLSIPIFIALFAAAAILRGNVAIEYTSSANDKIKEVFDESNQIVLVYSNSAEEKVGKICRSYSEAICYGNTIGEQKTYLELPEKAKSLGTEISEAPYLLRLFYYYYYNQDLSHKMSLPDFISFLQNDILTNENFAADISEDTKSDIDRLEFFLTDKMYTLQSSYTLASLLNIDAGNLQNLFVLYGANNPSSYLGTTVSNLRLSLAEFVNFMYADVLPSPTYSANITEAQKSTLAELAHLSNRDQLLTPVSSSDLAAFLGLNSSVTEQIFQYLVLSSHPEAALDPPLLASLLAEFKLSPIDFVNFLLENQTDPALADSLDEATLFRLTNAQFIMNDIISGTTFSYLELAQSFGLDPTNLRLLYSLYNIKYVTTPLLSPNEFVNFLLGSASAYLSPEQYSTLGLLRSVMDSAAANVPFTSKEIGGQLSPLAAATGKSLDQNLLDLLLLYHGSLTDFDETKTLSLDQFITFLAENIVDSPIFKSKITDEKRAEIKDAKTKIDSAKKMLVGPEHSRVLFETTLPEEGEQTFKYIEGIKEKLATENIKDAYMVGTSPMALEMSKTFENEINFITLLTMAAIFVVVAVTFRSLLIPAVLVFLIQTAVWTTTTIISLSGSTVYFLALIIVQAILMGATIDYAILYTSYYLEHRKRGLGVKNSLIESYSKSIHTIITSAAVLIIVTLIVGLLDAKSVIASKICTTISEGAACSAVLIIFVLPSLLAALDKIIIRGKKRNSKRGKVEKILPD